MVENDFCRRRAVLRGQETKQRRNLVKQKKQTMVNLSHSALVALWCNVDHTDTVSQCGPRCLDNGQAFCSFSRGGRGCVGERSDPMKCQGHYEFKSLNKDHTPNMKIVIERG